MRRTVIAILVAVLVLGPSARPAEAAPANHVTITTVANVRAGTPFNVTVEARDGNGDIDTDFDGTISVDASATGGSNLVGGTFTVAVSDGTGSAFGLMLNNAADGYRLTASGPGLTSGMSNAFNVTARRLVVTSAVSNVRAGTAFGLQVQARDADNALAENFTSGVALAADADGGSDFADDNALSTAANGTATFTGLTLGDAADGYTIRASASGVSAGFSDSFDVTASTLVISTVADHRAGDAFDVSVDARDALDNVAENFIGSISLSASATGGSNLVGGTATAVASGGEASFDARVLNNAADGYTLTAKAAGLADGVSNSFDVTARQLVITSAVANMLAGTQFALTVEARDADNAVAENFIGDVTASTAAPTGGSNFNGGTQTIGAIGGVAQFSGLAVYDAANGYTVDVGATGVVGAAGNSFDVTASHLAVSTVANVRAGDAFDVSVEARDANDNAAENFTGPISLDASATGGSNFLGGTANAPSTASTASFSDLVLNNAADGYTLSATAPSVPGGTSNTFNVTARQLTLTSAIANISAGTAFGVGVEARDADNVVAENFNAQVTIDASASGGSNFDGGSQSAIATSGSVAFAALALDDAADGYAISAGATGVVGTTSNNFNVTASHLAVSTVANVRSGDTFDVSVQARDANDNAAENFTGSISVDASATGGSNVVGGTANSAAIAGNANFDDLVLNNAADGYTLTASSPGLAGDVSNSFDVTARQLVVTNAIANMQVGTPFTVVVEARDADGAAAENFDASVAIDASAAGGSNFNGGTKTVGAGGGAATFTNLVLDTAANGYTVSASSSGVVSAVSNSFDVTASAARTDVSIDDVSVVEGNWGTRNATFTVTLSQPAPVAVTVNFATAGDSATSGADFTARAGTVTFAPGVTSQTISITVNGDRLNEADETFVVNLSGAVNGNIVDSEGVGTIGNDDAMPVLSVHPALALEGSGQSHTATLTVRLSAASGQDVRVTFQTVDGTARDGVGETQTDYTAGAGTLVFAPGETRQTITIALRNDLVVETDEYFFVDLRTPVNALVATPRTPVWIIDDDAPARQLLALGIQVLALDLDVFRTTNLLVDLRLNCGHLQQFARDLARYRGTYISRGDADALTAAANRLRSDIGCPV